MGKFAPAKMGEIDQDLMAAENISFEKLVFIWWLVPQGQKKSLHEVGVKTE